MYRDWRSRPVTTRPEHMFRQVPKVLRVLRRCSSRYAARTMALKGKSIWSGFTTEVRCPSWSISQLLRIAGPGTGGSSRKSNRYRNRLGGRYRGHRARVVAVLVSISGVGGPILPTKSTVAVNPDRAVRLGGGTSLG